MFEELRPLLFSLAHRILGAASDADKAVHEAWLRYEAAPQLPVADREFLPAAVTRISIGMLRSARGRGAPGEGGPAQEPDRPVELAESLSTAAVLLLERLSPLGRAVFVLREVFGCDPARIASVVGCPHAAGPRLVAAVSRASDGGGRPAPWPQCVTGSEQVARMLAAIVPPLIRIGVTMEMRQVNGRPGAVFRDRDGRALSALTLDIADGLIQTIHWRTL
ncbi:RNA polymerase subunit sigma-24 [Streptomyces sp. Ru71]|nr:RNA polymerase subunit sigma-24 [Streptomyces sp. Ru71]